MSVRYRAGATRITALSAPQWANKDGDKRQATSLPVELPGPDSDQIRGPLEVARGGWVPVLAIGAIVAMGSLLTTTLAPVVAQKPFANPPQPTLQARWLPDDTTQGMPSELRTVAQVVSQFRGPLLSPEKRPPALLPSTARGSPPELLPPAQVLPPGESLALPLSQVRWQPADGSKGTPKGLIPDAQFPVRDPQHTAPDRVRAVSDTSRGTQLELFPVAAIPLPPGTQNQVGPQKAWWQPQVLTYRADNPPATSLPLPIGTQTFAALQRALWQPDSTSRSVNPELFPVVVQSLPPGTAVATRTPERRWIATPLVYRADSPPSAAVTPLPPGEANWVILQRQVWLPADSTRGVPKGLIADDTVSVEQQPDAQAQSPAYPRSVVDTSQSAFAVAHAPPPAPPVVVAPNYGPIRASWQPIDGTTGTPATLRPDAQLPVRNLQHTPPDRVRPVVDTSTSAYPTAQAYVVIPLPPGTVAFVAAPRLVYQPADASFSSPLALIVQVIPPPTPTFQDGAGGITHYLWILYKKKKPDEAVIRAAQLVTEKAIADSWDQTYRQIERTVQAELKAQEIRVDAKRRREFTAYVQAAVKAEQVKREQEQKRQRRNKALIALLMAIDS